MKIIKRDGVICWWDEDLACFYREEAAPSVLKPGGLSAWATSRQFINLDRYLYPDPSREFRYPVEPPGISGWSRA